MDANVQPKKGSFFRSEMTFLTLLAPSGLLTISEHLPHTALRVVSKLQLSRSSSIAAIAFPVAPKSAKNGHFPPFLAIFHHFYALFPLPIQDARECGFAFGLPKRAFRRSFTWRNPIEPNLPALTKRRVLIGKKRPFLSRNDGRMYGFCTIAQKRGVCWPVTFQIRIQRRLSRRYSQSPGS